jgi:hypothetical protein
MVDTAKFKDQKRPNEQTPTTPEVVINTVNEPVSGKVDLGQASTQAPQVAASVGGNYLPSSVMDLDQPLAQDPQVITNSQELLPMSGKMDLEATLHRLIVEKKQKRQEERALQKQNSPKSVRLTAQSPVIDQALRSEVVTVVQDLDVEALKDLLIAQSLQNTQSLRDLRQYYDIARDNTTVVTVEELINVLRITPRAQGHTGPFAIKAEKERWADALRLFLMKVNYRSDFETKENAIRALRTMGKCWPHCWPGLIANMRVVLRNMPGKERSKLADKYGSLEELSDFQENFAHDHNASQLPRKKHLSEHVRHKDDIIHEAEFLDEPDTVEADWEEDGGENDGSVEEYFGERVGKGKRLMSAEKRKRENMQRKALKVVNQRR